MLPFELVKCQATVVSLFKCSLSCNPEMNLPTEVID